eukprot:scaffold1474_cov132-Cylindrotheca_fusiformis.AAC.12
MIPHGDPDSEMVDAFLQTGEDYCDRRLSRAARKLVHQHLLRILEAEDSNLFHGFLDHSDVWGLLEHWLHGSVRAGQECSLIPSLDTYRVDEEHTIVMEASRKTNGAYPTFVSQERLKSSKPQIWFQCAYCSKTFSSRFYLDAHLQRKHRVEEKSTVCPASDWCRAVGLANCHKVALEDEPYYGRGSNGWGDDGTLIRHKWMKKAHAVSCSVEEIRADCHSVLEGCGITEDSNGWCDSLVCPRRNFGNTISLDQLQSGWASEVQHHGWFFAVVFCLALYCGAYLLMRDEGSQLEEQSMQSQDHPERYRSWEKSKVPKSRTASHSIASTRKPNKRD